MSHQQNAQNAFAANLQQRKMLIATSPLFNKDLGTKSDGVLGGTTRIKLQNVGFTKRLVLFVSVVIDIGTANATLSAKGPFNLINKIRLIDYAGNMRVNCSGAALQEVNAARYRTYYGYNNEAATATFNNPVAPLATGASQTLSFFLEVPLTYSDTDLRGLLNTQTAVGDVMLEIDWNSTLVSSGSDDAVYNGAGTTTVIVHAGANINVQCTQEYFSPQANSDGSIYAPALDMLTAYAIEGGIRSSDNIAQGVEKLYNLPNLRSVTGLFYAVRVNSLMDCTTPTRHRLYVNGNNIMLDRANNTQLMEQRRYRNSDTRNGQYSMIFRDRPIETALLGNVQHGITFGAISGVCDVEYTVESYFPLNSTLPGLSQP